MGKDWRVRASAAIHTRAPERLKLGRELPPDDPTALLNVPTSHSQVSGWRPHLGHFCHSHATGGMAVSVRIRRSGHTRLTMQSIKIWAARWTGCEIPLLCSREDEIWRTRMQILDALHESIFFKSSPKDRQSQSPMLAARLGSGSFTLVVKLRRYSARVSNSCRATFESGSA